MPASWCLWIGIEKELPSLSPRMCCFFCCGEWSTSLIFLNVTSLKLARPFTSWPKVCECDVEILLSRCNCILPAHMNYYTLFISVSWGSWLTPSDNPVNIQLVRFIFTFLFGLLKLISLPSHALLLSWFVRSGETPAVTGWGVRRCCKAGSPSVLPGPGSGCLSSGGSLF